MKVKWTNQIPTKTGYYWAYLRSSWLENGDGRLLSLGGEIIIMLNVDELKFFYKDKWFQLNELTKIGVLFMPIERPNIPTKNDWDGRNFVGEF